MLGPGVLSLVFGYLYRVYTIRFPRKDLFRLFNGDSLLLANHLPCVGIRKSSCVLEVCECSTEGMRVFKSRVFCAFVSLRTLI